MDLIFRRNWLFTLLLIVLLLILVACGNSSLSSNTDSGSSNNESSNDNSAANSDEVYTVKISTVVNETNFIATGYNKFKEILEEKSEGRIQVDIYLNGTLAGSNEEELQFVSEGSIEMVAIPSFIGATIGGVKGFNIYDFPFIYGGERDNIYKIMYGPIGQEIQEEFEQNNNVKVLGYYDIGSMSLMNSKREVIKPEDLKGLNIRAPESPLFSDTIAEMGANPTPITFAEVYTSLQQGAIDGLTTTVQLMYDSQFYEVSKYVTLTRHHFVPYVFMVNKDFYDNLPEDLQNIVQESADEFVQFARELVEEHEFVAIEKLTEEGVQVYDLSEEELQEYINAVQPAIDKNIDLAGEEIYQRVINELGK